MSILSGLLLLCMLLVAYVSTIVFKKISLAAHYRVKYKKKKFKKPAIVPKEKINESEALVLIEEYEQQLFDDAARLFMLEPIQRVDIKDAEIIEATLLKKMPAKTQAYVRQMDLAEWSIFWTFYEQSLECYIGQYGIFFTHVDRFGQEQRHFVALDDV
jgi:hypothetical protein